MQKQLNPELFGSEKIRTEGAVTGEKLSRAPHSVRSNYAPKVQWTEESKGASRSESKLMESFAENQQLKSELEDLQIKFLEYQKINQTRFERYNQAITQLQDNMQILVGEWTQKISLLQNKLSDRKVLDSKMHEAIERHNTILKAFELRVGHLQKIINEKEAKLKDTQTELNTARMELANYKRVEI
jgi:DNA repair exonuclease SbcCD ATPase subunit